MYSEDWQALGDVQFRKWECYQLDWDINVDDHQVVGAPYGGPLAVLRDERKMSVASDRLGGYLKIFSSSGVSLGQIEWEIGRKLAGMGWTEAEELCTVLQDGTVSYYTLHGQKLFDREFRLFDAGTPARITEAIVWSQGFVALSTDFTLHIFDSTRGPGERPLYRLPVRLSGERPMTALALLQPYYDSDDGTSRLGSGRLQVLIATSDNSVVSIDELGMEDHNLQDSLAAPITKMAVSPDGRFLGCFTADGLLTVYTTKDLRRVLDPFETSTTSKPLGMVWCGKDSLVLYWRNMGLLMVGPFGDYIHFPYKQALALVPEPDCCRIVTSSSCEMLQRVPAATEAIRRIGSTEPAAMLFDAMEAFDEGDPKADENIRSIESGTMLVDAVKACVTAALSEWDEDKQQAYLKAAAYGKGFCDEEPEGSGLDADDEFVARCRKLRVLNHLRRREVGLPLTSGQYDRQGPVALIERLTLRHQHFLALKICDYLKLKKDRVVIHWACEFIQSRKALLRPDEEVKDEIVARLRSAGAGQVSFALIARAADKSRRRQLATMLLDYEPSPSKQVELLLEMGELELGLQKAIASSDMDLLCRAVLHVAREKQNSQEALLKLLSAYPEALRLLRSYYRHRLSSSDRTPWFLISLARADYVEAGTLVALQAYAQPSLVNRVDLLKEAAGVFARHKATPFFQKATEEQAELLEIQDRLEARSGKSESVFVDMSVSETLYNLIILASDQPGRAKDFLAEASNIAKKFKVPEKRFWHIKIKALAASGQWEALRQFAAEKKSPVGYKPFAQACIQYKQPATSTKAYIDRITQMEDRYDLYVEVKLWQDAADTALKMKDRNRLVEVQSLCHMPGLQRAIEEQLAKL